MKSCLVVGAGLSGIIAARRLLKKGWQVTVLEKSKGYGGRMATRRNGEAVFDHGAQALSVHGMFFRVIVEDLQDQGLLREWGRGFLNGDKILNLDGYLRYCGTAGMSPVARALAEPLTVCLQQTVTTLHPRPAGGWRVQSESGQSWEADALILTAPLPQSLQLLENSGLNPEPEQLQTLKAVRYDPCIAVMATLEAPCGLPDPGALAQSDPLSPVAWIADNQRKGISPVPAVTILGTAHFSRSHWKLDKDEAGLKLWQAARQWIQPEALALDVHRWRFAQVPEPLEQSHAQLNTPSPLLLAGDAFGPLMQPLERAALSGLAAANQLLTLQD
jgi:renalase